MPAILMYHRIADPGPGEPKANLFATPRDFDRQLDWLARRRFPVVSLERMLQAWNGAGPPLPPRCVALTFDDGYLDNYETAFRRLSERGLPAAFFVVSSRIGGADPNGAPCMSAGHLREMREAGMTIGSHGETHRLLARMPLEEARGELERSRAALEGILGGPVRWLCYPRGNFNRDVAAAARQAGYDGACSAIRDNRARPDQLFWLPRIMPMLGTTPLRFAYYFSFFYHILHKRKNRKRWGGFA